MRKLYLFSLLSLAALAGTSVRAFNNDGWPDLMFYDVLTGNNLVWFMNYNNEISSGYINSVPVGWRMIATGDFNNDGQLDLFWYDASSGESAVWFMNGTNFLSAALITYNGSPLIETDSNWAPVATGYFSGYVDKNVDILWRNNATGQLAVWFLNGTVMTMGANVSTYPSDLGWKVGGVADMNRDGYDDIIWRYTGSNTAYNVAIWYMNGTTLTSAALVTDYYGNQVSVPDLNWQIQGVGAVGGGVHFDLVWRYMSSSSPYIVYWYMDNSTYENAASTNPDTIPSNWNIGAVGDSKYDSQGKGMPDLWQKVNFGTLDQNSYGDYDADGISNLEEYQNNLNPTGDLGLQVFTNLK